MKALKQNIYDRYAQHLFIKGLAKTTVELYLNEAKHFLEFVDDVKAIDMQIVFKYLQRYGELAVSSRNQHNSALRTFINYLNTSVYPGAFHIKIPYIKFHRKLPTVLSIDELSNKLESLKVDSHNSNRWIEKRNYALIMMLYATGMRISEALKFRMSDIENQWIRIENAKGSKDRYVPIAESAVEALQDYIKACPFSIVKHTFVNYKGKPLNRISAYKVVQDILKMNPHSLRHHFATHMINGGADISVVSELLGHSNIVTTQIYTHVQKQQLADTVNKYHPMKKEAI
jgi:integrase/recombinase XerD